MPTVSVVMPMFNSAGTVLEAIRSIQNQTYSDWELIICDDCSTDESYCLAVECQQNDSRIRVLRNTQRMFAAYSRNLCIGQASGEFIVIQDSDDISHPDRITVSVEYLKRNPDIGFVCTSAILFDEKGQWGERTLEEGPRIARDLVRGSCFIHGATTFRKNCLDYVACYRVSQETRRGQDYDLFMRLYGAGAVGASISPKLYFIRETKDGYRRRAFRHRLAEAMIRFRGYRTMRLGLSSYLFVLKPIIVGVIPNSLMFLFRRMRGQT